MQYAIFTIIKLLLSCADLCSSRFQVARVQLTVLDCLKSLAAEQNSAQIQAALSKLNSELMDVTTVGHRVIDDYIDNPTLHFIHSIFMCYAAIDH